ncbi:NmrA family transcriptional regulator [Rhizobium sp. Root1220]|uniref:NmrA family NAD(P)-binding protein n=1 Tax=Rhizobium sp. Root1220 TaxID=1736432 RepID=UPI0006FC2AC1|nr:NmrA family transcriptional regulator [Rhizobium sp. Root1220]KQV84093.1 NmrA family transcriptional regulator [Rhizobium sp. Root1220]
MQNREIVLVGGAGKTGSRVAARLRERGINHRFASRSSVPKFDWEDRATWPGALAGATSAYVTFQPDVAVAWAADAIRTIAGAALECGLQHIVLLSGRGEEGAQRSEEALKASGIGYTILRASWSCQNFSEGIFAGSIATGQLALPVGEMREPFVDADDIADAAVAALVDPRHVGKTYELTGAHSITFREAVGEIARACGRPIAYREISMAEFKVDLSSAGVPDESIAFLEQLFGQTLDGRNSNPTEGVAEILGRPARAFSFYADEAAAAGAWRT